MASKPLVMGILNVTPDSFSDGGLYHQSTAAFKHAMQLHDNGADIIDIGGESTRPGSREVGLQEELDRVIPVLEKIKRQTDIRVSIDTKKPEVMRQAIISGADMINDVNALRAEGAIDLIGDSSVDVCLMHMQGTPAKMQQAPCYNNVVSDVFDFLQQQIKACEANGISRQRITIDPGFGFGKTLQHNYALLNNLNRFKQLDVSIVAGISRKSMIGEVTGRASQDRLAGSLGAAMIALMNGANVLRVHDVRETRDIVEVFWATQQ